MKYELEDLKLYHVYLEFMSYEFKILEKYGTFATLKNDIVKNIDRGLELVIKLSRELNIITSRNYSAISGKLSVLNNMMIGMIKVCRNIKECL